MDNKSPIPLWAVLAIGGAVLTASYILGAAGISMPRSTLIATAPERRLLPQVSVFASATTAGSFVTTSPATSSALNTSHKDYSEIDLAVGTNATFLIEDPEGRVTGKDFTTNHVLQEIPESAYSEDRIDNDATGELGITVSHQIQLSQPMEGTYNLTLLGLQNGIYDLSGRLFSSDGTDQPPLQQQGSISSGSQIKFQLTFTAAPGGISTLTKLSN